MVGINVIRSSPVAGSVVGDAGQSKFEGKVFVPSRRRLLGCTPQGAEIIPGQLTYVPGLLFVHPGHIGFITSFQLLIDADRTTGQSISQCLRSLTIELRRIAT